MAQANNKLRPAKPNLHNKHKGRSCTFLCLSICLCLLFSAIVTPNLQKSAEATIDKGQEIENLAGSKAPSTSKASGHDEPSKTVAECWQPLLKRLQKDNMGGNDLVTWFENMPEPYSARPMGVKVSTLFKIRFMPPHFPYFNKPVEKPSVYAGVVTEGNMQKCYDFLHKHKDIFQKAEKEYIVPKEILVALLMVETRLGNFMGSEHAFWSLACMASATKPEHIEGYLAKLPMNDEHTGWLSDILKARSDWAYTELKALILYCRLHKHDPLQITGSIYGAIGLCQFMPSNISFYAVDGNGDGKIDLFTLEDAVPSAANFLKTHGWRKNISDARMVRLLKYYNHSTAYANTIIELADGVKSLQLSAESEQKVPQSAPQPSRQAKPTKKS